MLQTGKLQTGNIKSFLERDIPPNLRFWQAFEILPKDNDFFKCKEEEERGSEEGRRQAVEEQRRRSFFVDRRPIENPVYTVSQKFINENSDYIFLFISYFEGDESRSQLQWPGPKQQESFSNPSNQSKDIFRRRQSSCAQEVFRTVHERNWKVTLVLQDPASARVTL